MEQLTLDKEPVSGPPAIRRSKPSLITIGEGRGQRQLCSISRFSLPVAADYVMSNPDKWIPVGEMAKTLYGANTITNKKRFRKGASRLLNYLSRERKELLLYEYDGPRIAAVKVYRGASEAERRSAALCLEQMAQRNQWTQEKLDRCKRIIDLTVAPAA